ncbi:hypothetical protein ABZ516_25690 [Streptomyces sp. NPDC019826]
MARRRRRARLPMAVVAAVAVMSTLAAGGPAAGGTGTAPGPDEPTIRWTEYGIPHIIASD